MKLVFGIFVTVIVMLSFGLVDSGMLEERHWDFVCGSSDETVERLYNCYFEMFPNLVNSYNNLKLCTGMSFPEIIKTFCNERVFIKSKEGNLLLSCLTKDPEFYRKRDDKPNGMIKCIEKEPLFQNRASE
uniref:Venom protein n=1 Tax=Hadrurus spadix TaxID=141984 RepID=A0A1W7R960_9SCOR